MNGVDENAPDQEDEERRAMVGAMMFLEGFAYTRAILKGLGGAGG